MIHKKEGDRWHLNNGIQLDDDDCKLLTSIKRWDNFTFSYPEGDKIPHLQNLLTQIGKALTSDRSQTLCLAAEWYWDSFKGNDEILRYVRRMTTLEILLGDGVNTSKASLGEILGNRLAYLIGRSHRERSDVLE